MKLSLSQRIALIRRSFYRSFDDYDNNIYWYVVDVYDDNLVAVAEHEDDKAYRFNYSFDEEAGEVTFDNVKTPVHREWVESERSALIAQKRSDLGSEEERSEKDNENIAPVNDHTASVPDVVLRSCGSNARMSSDGHRTTFQIMTGLPARDQLILDPDGLDTTAYMQNPVVLWQHGKSKVRDFRPIGKCVSITRNDKGYLATMEWNTDEFSQSIRNDVSNGFLNMASVKWRSIERKVTHYEGRDYLTDTKSELLEFSVVGVGADAQALVTARDSEEIDDLKDLVRGLADSVKSLTNLVTVSTATANDARSSSGAKVTTDAPAEDLPTIEKPTPKRSEPVAVTATAEATEALVRSLVPSIQAIVKNQFDRATGRA